MSELQYRFWLIQKELSFEEAYSLLRQGKLASPCAYLHLYVAKYIESTTRWIASQPVWERVSWSGYGLTLSGPVIIQADGALALEKICDMWAALFAQSPQQLLLKDIPYVHHDDRILERDATIRDLQTIADFAKTVQAGDHYILQIGL